MVGFVRTIALADATQMVTAFRQGLNEAGFVEGQNVLVEYHSAEGQPDRSRALVNRAIETGNHLSGRD